MEILSWSGFSWVGDELSEGGKMTNNEGKSSKLSAAIERLRRLGVRVTDGTCKGNAIGIVGESGVPSRKLGTTMIPLIVRHRPLINAVAG